MFKKNPNIMRRGRPNAKISFFYHKHGGSIGSDSYQYLYTGQEMSTEGMLEIKAGIIKEFSDEDLKMEIKYLEVTNVKYLTKQEVDEFESEI